MKEAYLKILLQEKEKWEADMRQLNIGYIHHEKSKKFHLDNIERINNEIKNLFV